MYRNIVFSLVLVAILFLSSEACQILKSNKRMICYYASWAGHTRISPANIQPEDFDPCLCSHVMYAFVNLRNSKLELTENDKNLFPRMAKWKLKNPLIKISISIGGWLEQSTHFTPMVSTAENRKLFCQSVIDVVRQYGFDGIDIDWEYPSYSQRDQYTATIQTCYDMFVKESQTSGKSRIMLTAATAPDSRMGSLDIPALNRLMDFVMPMTYDIHGSWDGNQAHHSALYGWDGADTTLKNYINAGMSPSKLNLGLAAYGRTTSITGPYTQEWGVLSYYEVCQLLSKTWYEIYDDTKKVPKAVDRNTGGHVFYDNQRSMRDKANYVINTNIGGAFIWDTSLDDFKNQFCCQGNYPLISTVLNVFTGNSTISTNTFCGDSISTTTSSTILSTLSTTSFTTSAGSLITSSTQITPAVVGVCAPGNTLVPHPTDCSKFIKCYPLNEAQTQFLEFVTSCPPDLLFNSVFKICDWPQNVVCKIGTTTTAAPTTTTKPSTTTASTTTTTTKAPTTTTTKTTTTIASTTTTISSLSGCTGGRTAIAKPGDCRKLILCSTGAELSCFDGYAFDETTQKCVSIYLLPCAAQFVATTTSTPTTTTAEFTCSSDGLFPHYYDCKSFYECYGGVAKKLTCPILSSTQTVFDFVYKKCYFKTSAITFPGCV